MATLARPIARRRGVPLTSSLRSSLRRLPLVQFELPVVRKRLDAALAEAGPAAPPSLVGALHTAAVVSCAERQRWDLLAPLLRAAASDRSHGAGAYTAALDAIARAGPAGASSCEVGGEAGGGEEEGGTTASRRLALSRGVADDMRAAGHSPSRLTFCSSCAALALPHCVSSHALAVGRLALRHLLWSARGAGEDPMELLLHEMRRGLQHVDGTACALLFCSTLINKREATVLPRLDTDGGLMDSGSVRPPPPSTPSSPPAPRTHARRGGGRRTSLGRIASRAAAVAAVVEVVVAVEEVED